MVLPQGSLDATGDVFEPHRLIGTDGVRTAPAGSPGRGYATATVVHWESALRAFAAYLEAGTGPNGQLVPRWLLAWVGRANANHNPMQLFPGERAGRYRPKMARLVPGSDPG